jgi:GntR family transcriptional regulator
MRPIGLDSQSGMTLYSQVASVLRRRIAQGDWRGGQEVPTLEALCEQFGVARVTARQAIQLLVSEGLLSSRRGRRTTVVERQGDERTPLPPALVAPLDQVPDYSITLVEKDEDTVLPESFRSYGRSDGAYVRVRKVDREAKIPYCLSDIYIPKSLYRRFMEGAETRAKLARLVREASRPPLASVKERITVSSADFEEARLLGCPLASPVARVQRIFLNRSGRVVYAGWSVYRGDRFVVERELIDHLSGG